MESLQATYDVPRCYLQPGANSTQANSSVSLGAEMLPVEGRALEGDWATRTKPYLRNLSTTYILHQGQQGL